MTTSGKKMQRRSDNMKMLLGGYVSDVLKEHRENDPHADFGVQGGIIRERVGFFISKHYDVNHKMIRHYHSPTNHEVDMVDQFISDGIDYREVVRPFYYENKEEYRRINEQPVLDGNIGCVLLDVESKKFLRITDFETTMVQQGNASVVNYFMSPVWTTKVVTDILQKSDDKSYNIKAIRVREPQLYHVAEL